MEGLRKTRWILGCVFRSFFMIDIEARAMEALAPGVKFCLGKR